MKALSVMNRRALILLIILLGAVIVGIGFIFYFQSFRTVHFDFKQSDLKITVYKKEGQSATSSIDTLTGSTDKRLQQGQYLFVPIGDTYNPAPVEFSVGPTDTTVEVNPSFSSTYRSSLLQVELPAIKQAIRARYPTVIDSFTISDGEIFKQGQWYGTTLIQNTASADEEGDVYRVVLKKEAGKWSVKTEPTLVLSAKVYPNIPKDILSSVNAR
jgi:hypothetical protein